MKLAGELRAANALNRRLADQLVGQHFALVEVETRTKPFGRVLVIDAAPEDETTQHGELLLLCDRTVDLHYIDVPCPLRSDYFDECLQAAFELHRTPKRFSQMTTLIGPHRQIGMLRFKRDPRGRMKECEALLEAEVFQAVLDELKPANETQPIKTRQQPVETNPAQTKEQQASVDGAKTPDGAEELPF